MITPEMLKPLIDKWGGVLEIVLDVSNESWCSTLVDNHSNFKASMELLSRRYTPETVVQELDEYFIIISMQDLISDTQRWSLVSFSMTIT